MAGVLTVRAGVEAGGPIFDGTAGAVIARWASEVTSELTREGMAMLRSFPMNKTGRAHGNFQAALHPLRVSGSEARIPGPMITGVVWSPWLEGTSRRNESTRFKGYHLFRATAARLRRDAVDVGNKVAARLLPLIGGGP